jgi:hypothetical protein
MSCVGCGEMVFAAEAVKLERGLWHTSCFACCACGTRLTLKTFVTSPFAGGDPNQIFCRRCAPVSKPSVDGEGVDFQRVKNRPRVSIVNEQVRGELAGKVSLSGFSSHIHVSGGGGGGGRRASKDVDAMQSGPLLAGPARAEVPQREEASPRMDLAAIRRKLRAASGQDDNAVASGSSSERRGDSSRDAVVFESPFRQMRKPNMPWAGPSGGRNRDALALLSADLIALREKPEQGDLAFTAGEGDVDEAFFAHRIVIAHRCPRLLERADSDGLITIEGCHPAVFRSFLNYVYGGAVRLR